MGSIGQGREWPFSIQEDFLPRNTLPSLGRLQPIPPTPADPLTIGLLSYWRLEEAFDQLRIDRIGTNDLVDVGAMGGPILGIVGSGANHTGSANSFLDGGAASSSGTLDFDGTSSFTIAGWLKLDTSVGVNSSIVSKFTDVGNIRQWLLFRRSSTSKLQFNISRDGTAANTIAVQSPTSITTGTFFFFLAEFDAVGDIITASINNEAPNTTAAGQQSAPYRHLIYHSIPYLLRTTKVCRTYSNICCALEDCGPAVRNHSCSTAAPESI